MKQIFTTALIIFFCISFTNAQKALPEQIINDYFAQTEQGDRSMQQVGFEVTLDRDDEKTGLRKVHALQKINGIYNRSGILTITSGRFGKAMVVDHFASDQAAQRGPSISSEEAIKKAFKFHNFENVELSLKESKDTPDQQKIYNRNESTSDDILARLMYIEHRGELILTWETQMHTADRQNYWISYIDATTGQLLESEDKVLHCSFGDGVVYDASPEEQKWIDDKHHQMHMEAAHRWDEMEEQTSFVKAMENDEHNHHVVNQLKNSAMMAPANTYLVLDMPADAPNDLSATNTQTTVITAGDPVASPYGWTSTDNVSQYSYTRGNNVWAFYDPSPGPLGGAPNPGSSAQASATDPINMTSEFIYPWDLTQEPEYSVVSTTNQFPNRNAAITNLFYWNNLIHDVFYGYGFDEAGRNFQFDNMGNGGLGNDDVLAQAQDGGGTNNANFLTLADGVNGQMQMYIWTTSTLDTIVKITMVDIPTSVAAGDGFPALQGALYNAAMPINLNTNPVLNKVFVLVNDGCGSSEGCGAGGGVGLPPCNNEETADKIVLIDRGSCSFVEKVDGAQKGGAAGVIIMNNNSSQPDQVAAMGGTDPTVNTITIPAVMVSYNSGLLLKAALADGATIIGSLDQENLPEPKKDGDFDNGIIAHEYGHGISSRTSPQTATGGSLSGSEQGGEGWSDYMALFLSTTSSDLIANPDYPNGQLPNKGIGTYVIFEDSNGGGIRPRRYSVDETINEYTFTGATNGGFGVGNAAEITIPHGIGFIWCSMLWEVTQNLVDEYGFNDDVYYIPPSTGNLAADITAIGANNAGNNLAMKLILEGISLQSPSPTFNSMRDGILKADTLMYDGTHSCLIWEAFASRGLGINVQNGSNAIGDEVDGYATPCRTTDIYYDIVKTAVSITNNNTAITYNLLVTNTAINNNTGTDVVVIDELPENLIFLDATGAPFTQDGQTITFTIPSLAMSEQVTLTIDAFVNTPTTSIPVSFFDFEVGEQGWVAVPGGFNEFARETGDAANAHSGSAFFFTDNSGQGGANTMLMSPVLDTSVTNRQLRFWHKFSTDAGYDGGFIETTFDGVTWARMSFQENGYNGALNSTFNPANAGAAFTGLVPGYIESAGAIPDGATQVRFVFSEDTGFGGGEGWWIDDVRIIAQPLNIHNSAIVTDPIDSGGRVHESSASTIILPAQPGNACELVSITADEGVGSLPFAIGCARDGDTIQFAVALQTDTIMLENNNALFDKDLTLISQPIDSVFIMGSGVQETFGVLVGSTVSLVGLHVIAGTGLNGAALFNAGEVTVTDVQIYEHPDGSESAILITNQGILQVKGTTNIRK